MVGVPGGPAFRGLDGLGGVVVHVVVVPPLLVPGHLEKESLICQENLGKRDISCLIIYGRRSRHDGPEVVLHEVSPAVLEAGTRPVLLVRFFVVRRAKDVPDLVPHVVEHGVGVGDAEGLAGDELERRPPLPI